MQMFGRTVIYTDVSSVTAENVCEVLSKAVTVHSQNSAEINYLYDYYKGKTPILSKTKEIRTDINHQICENRANEIVSFKTGYCFGEPVQYILRGEKAGLVKAIDTLNDYMFYSDKAAADRRLADWMHIAGVGYRMALPVKERDEDEPPFEFYTLDPRHTFVVYSSGIGNKPMMCVKCVMKENQIPVYSVYTKNMYFEIENGVLMKAEPHVLGMLPIIEYPANTARLGAFEIVLPLLDALNEVQSNRLDDVVQYVNSFLALLGGEIDAEALKNLSEYKMLCLPDGVDAKYLSQAMNQGDIQTLADAIRHSILSICGVPSQSGESASTSDTGSAVILRGGWEQAEARAKSTEAEFKRSEKQFLRLILRILRDTVGTPLKPQDIESKFTRRYVDNILTKTQALQQMLQAGIAPSVAIATCGLWNDPTDIYLQSKKYLEQWDVTDDADVRTDGHSHDEAPEDDPEGIRQEPSDDGDGRT